MNEFSYVQENMLNKTDIKIRYLDTVTIIPICLVDIYDKDNTISIRRKISKKLDLIKYDSVNNVYFVDVEYNSEIGLIF